MSYFMVVEEHRSTKLFIISINSVNHQQSQSLWWANVAVRTLDAGSHLG